MKCYVHPEIDAVNVCSECGKGICATCAVTIEGRTYCKRDLSRAFSRQRAPGIAQKPAFQMPPPEPATDQSDPAEPTEAETDQTGSEEPPEDEEQTQDRSSSQDAGDSQQSSDESSDAE
jgi:hypothetical protein